MTVWLIRGGRHGEREDFALENRVAVIGWDELPNLSDLKSREELTELLEENYSDTKPQARVNWMGSIWPFIHDIKKGDLVAMPLKTRGNVAFGEVLGDYSYQPDNPHDAKHVRPVKWIDEIPRNQIDADILSSLGSLRTFCRVNAEDAEERLRYILKIGGGHSVEAFQETPEAEAPIDYEQLARDQISSAIIQNFKGHGLETLVGAVLEAQGYKIRVSPEGPDGGVDIIAGRGPLGFDTPRLVVQVKSGNSPVDVSVMRELTGVMSAFGADSGLIVAWGGYRGVVEKENARQFFKIRLWDADMLVKMVQENYEHLPEDIQADLPLKRIWILVPEEEE
ncbi:MAG: restriction endonuclease [Chloroflexota bacterium]|nr:restriction endonuclease [Chloroflexota bacterium]